MLSLIFALVQQFEVMASDNATPEKTTTVRVTVKVRRDLVPPEFRNNGVYDKEIYETADVGSSVITITARDSDSVVSLSVKVIRNMDT